MTLGYAWFDSYNSVGYVLTLHISPNTVCPYLPIPKEAFFLCRVAISTPLEEMFYGSKMTARS